jgi:hypothetical protein
MAKVKGLDEAFENLELSDEEKVEKVTTEEQKKSLEKVQRSSRRTKVIGVRFLEEDIPNLKKLVKMEAGENSLSAGIRKIIYNAMHENKII